MAFEMKITDFFKIGKKTIFSGEVVRGIVPNNCPALLRVDHETVIKIHIRGEVQNHSKDIDIWTDSPVMLDREQLKHKILVLESIC